MNEIIEDLRNKITLGEKEAYNVSSSDFPGTYDGYDDSWDHHKFAKNFRIEIVRVEEREMEMDLVGVDASFANALRRILIAEIPTMAFDRIEVKQNTSCIYDEMLSHRIGLLPVKCDPRLFEFRAKDSNEMTSEDSLQFSLHFKCAKNSSNPNSSNNKVLSKNLIWVPIGSQSYPKEDEPRVVDDNILIAKLNPGQEIELTAYCFKGIGKDHAKFSPVATAFYRQHPEIKLKKRIFGEDAVLLRDLFSQGVIGLDTNEEGEVEARVENSRKDMLSRNVFRNNQLKSLVSIKLIRNHFIFTIESTGCLSSHDLFRESLRVLRLKCSFFAQQLSDLGF